MKRVVIAENFTNKKSALNSIKQKLENDPEFEGYTFDVHDTHSTVDITDPNGIIYARVHPESDDTATVTRVRNQYKYVGPGQGDYVLESSTSNQKTFSDIVVTLDTLESSMQKILP